MNIFESTQHLYNTLASQVKPVSPRIEASVSSIMGLSQVPKKGTLIRFIVDYQDVFQEDYSMYGNDFSSVLESHFSQRVLNSCALDGLVLSEVEAVTISEFCLNAHDVYMELTGSLETAERWLDELACGRLGLYGLESESLIVGAYSKVTEIAHVKNDFYVMLHRLVNLLQKDGRFSVEDFKGFYCEPIEDAHTATLQQAENTDEITQAHADLKHTKQAEIRQENAIPTPLNAHS